MDICSLLSERDIQMQLWILLWVMVGNFATYLAWKKYGSKTIPTWQGIVKKAFIGFIAWGLFLVAYAGIENMGHVQVIIPALSFGISAEVIIGAFIQQKLEMIIKKK